LEWVGFAFGMVTFGGGGGGVFLVLRSVLGVQLVGLIAGMVTFGREGLRLLFALCAPSFCLSGAEGRGR
jgi:hypothetical protein